MPTNKHKQTLKKLHFVSQAAKSLFLRIVKNKQWLCMKKNEPYFFAS